jgi:hypothetical protein
MKRASSNSGTDSDKRSSKRAWGRCPRVATKKKIKSSFGWLTCPKTHGLTQSVHPFQISPYLQERICFVGQQAVFEDASTMLAELVGVAVTAKQIERVCHHIGALLEAPTEASEGVAPEPAAAEAGVVYGMVDGSMISTRTEGWKEVKLGRLFAEEAHEKGQAGQRGRIEGSIYTAHLGHYEAFLSKWRSELTAVEKRPLVFLADGAQWFWDWASANYPEALQILDYYHCKSYLWSFAKVYFKDKKHQQARSKWVEKQQDLLFEDAVDQVIEEVEQLPRRGVEDLIARGKILSYFRHNRSRMYYGSYRRQGLLIGSGPIEAAHRNVIQQRLKLAGQRWTPEGAQQVANLRVLRRSDRWEKVIALTRTRKRAA